MMALQVRNSQVELIAGRVGDAGRNDWRPAQSGEKKSVQRLVRMSRWMIAGVNESQGSRGQWGRNLNTSNDDKHFISEAGGMGDNTGEGAIIPTLIH